MRWFRPIGLRSVLDPLLLALIRAHLTSVSRDSKMSDTHTSDSPAFLSPAETVPQSLRDLLEEADGCLQSRFLTGGTSCARRALEVLLGAARAEGDTYEDRVKSLREKHSVSQMLTTILIQCGAASEREGAKLTANVLEVYLVAIKAIVYELYVLGPERIQRLQYVRRLVERLDKTVAIQVAAPGGDLAEPAQPVNDGDANEPGAAVTGRRRPGVAALARS